MKLDGSDRRADPFRCGESIVARGSREEYGELLPADASSGLAMPRHRCQRVRNAAQQAVSLRMTEAVVDALEVIEIDHQQRHRQVRPLRRGMLLVQARPEIAQVLESCQLIGKGIFAQAQVETAELLLVPP
jgi:hypothetical protein